MSKFHVVIDVLVQETYEVEAQDADEAAELWGDEVPSVTVEPGSCLHLSVTEDGFEFSGEVIYKCDNCGERWNEGA